MKGILLFLVLQFAMAGGRLLADVVILKDGRQISGSVESGNTQELHVKVADQSQTIDVHDLNAIQLGTAPAAPPPSKAAASAPAAQADILILKDGTRVSGRYWSIDAAAVHLLVDNRLQQFPRADVSAVTLGGYTLPAPPAPSTPPTPSSTPPPPTPAPHPAAAPPPTERPTLTRSTQPPQPPTMQRPAAAPSPAAPTHVSQPNEIGAVYFWNGKDLTPLERNQAVPRGSGSSQYFEIPGPKSRVRVEEATVHAFILRLPKGVDPKTYTLFFLETADGARRTRMQQGRRGGSTFATWPFDIEINDASGYMTYALKVKDLPTGEYSFSPSSSNDGYCFGVDAAQ